MATVRTLSIQGTRITPRLRAQIEEEAKKTLRAVRASEGLDAKEKALLIDILRPLADATKTEPVVMRMHTHVLQGIRIGGGIFANGGNGTGTVDCVNTCNFEYEKCVQNNSEFLCSLQAIACLAGCI